jgi:hypothetical protein
MKALYFIALLAAVQYLFGCAGQVDAPTVETDSGCTTTDAPFQEVNVDAGLCYVSFVYCTAIGLPYLTEVR